MRLFLNFKDTSEVGVGVIIQNDEWANSYVEYKREDDYLPM